MHPITAKSHHLSFCSKYAFNLLIILLFFSSGCSSLHPEQPDLQKLYALQKGNTDQPPVILIHGITGARLHDPSNNTELWPGSLSNLLFSNYHYLRNDIDPDTLEVLPTPYEITGITDEAVGRDFYGRVIETLTSAGSYELADLNSLNPKQQSLFIFAYDWRQDNVITARKLHQFIQAIKAKYNKPELKVDVVAHSMGGLITRYYARYGTEDVINDNDFEVTNAGAKHLRRVILLGTPNFGSVGSVDAFANGVKIGLKRIPPEVLVTFPSMYQLFPHALNNWVVNTRGEPLDRDVFDIDIWERLQLSIFEPTRKQALEAENSKEVFGNKFSVLSAFMRKHLERARRFTWSLTVPLPETKVSYVVFGGNCELTMARALIEDENSEDVGLHFDPKHIHHPKPGVNYEQLMLEPGDGTVTKASLLARQSYDPTIPRHEYSNFPLDYSFFLCESHDALTGNISFQDNLLNVLLSVDENL